MPFRLEILDRVSDPGNGGANEDICGHTPASAWVLDGATGLGDRPLLPGNSDAAWLVSAYDARFRAHADHKGCKLQDLFAEVISEVAAEFEMRKVRSGSSRFELPSAGIAFVRVETGILEFARLGDCRAIITCAGGTRTISTGTSNLQFLDAAVVKKMEELRRSKPSMNYRQIRHAVQGDLRANRNLLNTGGGYWVLSTDTSAASRIEVGSKALERVDSIRGLLVTDGFYRLVDTLGIYPDDMSLFNAALDRGLSNMLVQLRELEDFDPECIAYPRLKPKDDATALLFEIA